MSTIMGVHDDSGMFPTLIHCAGWSNAPFSPVIANLLTDIQGSVLMAPEHELNLANTSFLTPFHSKSYSGLVKTDILMADSYSISLK